MSRGRATAIGFGAVLLWALLALLTVGTGAVPPFQLLAVCFAVGGVLGLGWIAAGGCGQGPAVWAVGIGGIFGYRFFCFTGLSGSRRRGRRA